MTERVGVLDIGSNSVRLLVADCVDGQVFSVYTEKITCRLLGGFRDGLLASDALMRTAKAIADLTAVARARGATGVYGFGTAAMRDGANAHVLVEGAAALGVPVEIMSGEREAQLAYQGAAPTGRCGVIDIGGGSTELIVGNDGVVQRAASAQIGGVRLFGQITGREGAEALIALASEPLRTAWAAVSQAPRAERWVGVGGTVTTLAAMGLKLARYDPARVEGYPLTALETRRWLDRLIDMPSDARKAIPGLSPERADIMPCCAAVLAAFFAVSGVTGLAVSDRDNLLGYARSLVQPSQAPG